MDAIVQLIRKTGTGLEDIRQLKDKLQKEEKALKKHAGQAEAALAAHAVDAKQHTLGYAYLLALKASTEYKSHNEFIDQARQLFIHGDAAQLHLAVKQVVAVERKFFVSVQLTNRWAHAAQALEVLLGKLEAVHGGYREQITSLHADFLAVCIKAKQHNLALGVIDGARFIVAPKETDVTPQDFLQFFYYGGLVYVNTKQFAKAVDCFQQVLTIPTSAVSAIQVEAYKKFALCSIIATGELARLPEKLTSAIVLRSVERLSPAYTDLAKAYRQGVDAVNAVITANAELYRKDKNLGLARALVPALVRSNILRLTATYVTVSLRDLAASARLPSPQEAERHILNMIEDGVLHATIDQKEGMVSFTEDTEAYDNTQMAAQLDAKIKEVAALTERVRQADTELQLSQVYITKTNPSHSYPSQMYATALSSSSSSSSDYRGGQHLWADRAEEEMMQRAMEQSLLTP